MGRRDKERGRGRSRSRGNVIPGIGARSGASYPIAGVDFGLETVVVTQDVVTGGPLTVAEEDALLDRMDDIRRNLANDIVHSEDEEEVVESGSSGPAREDAKETLESSDENVDD